MRLTTLLLFPLSAVVRCLVFSADLQSIPATAALPSSLPQNLFPIATAIPVSNSSVTSKLDLRQLPAPDTHDLLPRAGVIIASALPGATQANPVTTNWVETTINGLTTYVAVVYSQSFASVPDQGNTVMSGAIGMGTLTGTVGVVKAKEASSGTRKFGVMGGLVAAGMIMGGALVVL